MKQKSKQEKHFLKRKSDILSKKDKSSINKWDFKIKNLCEKINKLNDYYTTSSCAGRIVLIKDEGRKQPGLFLFVGHELITLNKLLKEIKGVKDKKISGLINFKQEGVILHVACSSLEKAQQFLDKGKSAGWKKSGIIASNSRFVVELMTSEKLELPLIENGNLLFDENYLKILISEANKKLKKSWEKIERLERSI